jgi:hypothetical protein
MIRVLTAFLFFALPAAAQEPVLRAELEADATIPGQAVSLRLTVLAPTFFPQPPIWPDYQAPNLLVRIAATGPVSERIDGVTWSGVSRRYLITPMLPGPVGLPGREVTVTWSDPETNVPRRTALPVNALTITGLVPEGAKKLDPLIAANALKLEQTVEGTPEDMVPGDSLTRTVIATIQGAPTMFLPTLMPPHVIEGLRAYQDSPVLEETTNRGVIRGTRKERVTLVAEGGGRGEAPAVSLDWYNLGTGKVETAELPAIPVFVEGPPAVSDASPPTDWQAIVLAGFVILIALGLSAKTLRHLVPYLAAGFRRRRARWIASEQFAWRSLQRAIGARDYAAVRPALDVWADRVTGSDPRREPRLSNALASLGAARYGAGGHSGGQDWRKLDRLLRELRQSQTQRQPRAVLPPLNPRT